MSLRLPTRPRGYSLELFSDSDWFDKRDKPSVSPIGTEPDEQMCENQRLFVTYWPWRNDIRAHSHRPLFDCDYSRESIYCCLGGGYMCLIRCTWQKDSTIPSHEISPKGMHRPLWCNSALTWIYEPLEALMCGSVALTVWNVPSYSRKIDQLQLICCNPHWYSLYQFL